MNQLTKTSTPSAIETYFLNVLDMARSNNEFPVLLDEVWPIVYSTKGNAVRELTANFIQDVDYQIFIQNDKNPSVGRPIEDYRLTVSCLEYLIARKVRPVFEVYRRVFHQVAFNIPKTLPEALQLAADLARQVEEKKALLAKTECVLKETAQSLAEARPKADYCDHVLCSVSLISVRQIAKDYGRSANWLNNYLASKGIQFRQGKQWLLYDKYARQDLARSVTAQGTGRGDNQTYMLTKWTERGRKFIARLLARDGIYPVPTAEEQAAIYHQLEML